MREVGGTYRKLSARKGNWQTRDSTAAVSSEEAGLGGLANFDYEFDPKDIKFWSSEAPNLYYVILSLEIDGKSI